MLTLTVTALVAVSPWKTGAHPPNDLSPYARKFMRGCRHDDQSKANFFGDITLINVGIQGPLSFTKILNILAERPQLRVLESSLMLLLLYRNCYVKVTKYFSSLQFWLKDHTDDSKVTETYHFCDD